MGSEVRVEETEATAEEEGYSEPRRRGLRRSGFPAGKGKETRCLLLLRPSPYAGVGSGRELHDVSASTIVSILPVCWFLAKFFNSSGS